MEGGGGKQKRSRRGPLLFETEQSNERREGGARWCHTALAVFWKAVLEVALQDTAAAFPSRFVMINMSNQHQTR